MAGQDLIGNELNDLEQRGGQAAYPHKGTDLVGGALGDIENRGGTSHSQPHNETTGSPISEAGSQAQDAASQLSALGKGFTGGAAVDLVGAAKGGVGSVVVAGIKRHKKGVFGGVAGVVMSILLLALLSSLPFGFTSTMENVKAKEMKVLNENIASMNDSFMSYYIVKYLAPGMQLKQCTSTIVDRNCAVSAKGDGVVSRMFRAWQKASIENQWAKNGFEIRRDRATNRYFIRATGTGDIDITRYVANANDNMFHEIDRSDLRSVIRESHMRSSKWDRILVRFGWGKKTIRLAYGNVRCVLSCKVLTFKENYFSEPIAQKKRAFKIKFAQRVLYPRSQMIGLAFECLFAGSKCNPNEPDVREDGTYRTKFEAQLQTKIADLLATEGGEQTLKKAQAVAAALQEKGFQRVVIEAIVKSLLSKAGSSEAAAQAAAQTSATVAGTAVPVFFAVNGFATIVTLLSSAGPTLAATSTMLQKASMVSTYSMNSAYSDEIKSSNVDATEVSSFSELFFQRSATAKRRHHGRLWGRRYAAV